MKCSPVLAVLAASLSAPSSVHGAASNVRILRSVVRGTAGNDGIFGLVAVTEGDDGAVTVEADVSGLPDGFHGFHVHEYGDAAGAADGTAAGGHFDPSGDAPHAGPDDRPDKRHVGDLGNIESSGGAATFRLTFSKDDPYRPTIVSDMRNSVIGRAFVIHADKDDTTTQPTGNAGKRLAVGVIGIGNDALYNDEKGDADPTAVEVTEHIESADFPEPKALVCNIIGAANGYGSAVPAEGGNSSKLLLFGARVSAPTPNAVHGYHVHHYGEEYRYNPAAAANGTADSSKRDLSRAGGHYNPTGVEHALPPQNVRHYGDGGSIVVDANRVGVASVALPSGVATLKHLVGRTCLVHADADDGSQPSGNAGARVAAGQLGWANPDTCVDPAVCLLPVEEPSGGLRSVAAGAAAVLIAGGALVSSLLMM